MKDLKDVPISTFLATTLIIIFILYYTQIIKTVSCSKDIHEIFIRNFVHVESYHLVTNLFALYALSRVEEEMGFYPFLYLIIFLVLINTIVEYIVRKFKPDITCSLGFSGILFGITTWELITHRSISPSLLLAISLMVVKPNLTNKNISFSGHVIGALSGVIGGVLWKQMNDEKIV